MLIPRVSRVNEHCQTFRPIIRFSLLFELYHDTFDRRYPVTSTYTHDTQGSLPEPVREFILFHGSGPYIRSKSDRNKRFSFASGSGSRLVERPIDYYKFAFTCLRYGDGELRDC